MTKRYLGDGVYVDFDGYGLVLTTSNGVFVSNTIYLEPIVYKALTEYVASLSNEHAEKEQLKKELGEE